MGRIHLSSKQQVCLLMNGDLDGDSDQTRCDDLCNDYEQLKFVLFIKITLPTLVKSECNHLGNVQINLRKHISWTHFFF